MEPFVNARRAWGNKAQRHCGTRSGVFNRFWQTCDLMQSGRVTLLDQDMILPALCIGKKSYTWFIVSEVEMTKMSICHVELVRGNLKVMRIFDYSGKEWRCVACNTEKKLPWLRHFSTKVLFREVKVTLRFEQVGPYSLDALKGVLAAAVEKDDDILTQHEEASEILEKLRKTASLGQVFNLYRWMTKDFRKYDAPTAGRPVSP